MQNKLFKQSSVERFSSPEKLNDYIQVSNPAGWMVLSAALALLIGVLIWGFFGSLTETVSFSGIAREGVLRCYVSSADSAALEEAMAVEIVPAAAQETGAFAGSISHIAAQPLSYMEASAGVESDYLLDALELTTWNIGVDVTTDQTLYDGIVYRVTAVTDIRRPIDLLFE